ncbi:hypothetical protein [uncultured Cyclobacterium sp.]|uniref:DinB family protein n=1 Tax=uncultured Cyclobacterium sp. TaxID=453820 RepID=UPI0030EC7796|tara:strand:- start:144057 stop:144569 length:513 start_codon:yes stop_codon:yes gene_type:complete
MQAECKQNLNQLSFLLGSLSTEQYNYKSELLSGASIGQHIRHIIEFYTCLKESFCLNLTQINYDKRKRDKSIEQDAKKAILTIDKLIDFLNEEKVVGKAALVANFSLEEDHDCIVPSSYRRELAYCLEHSIHHQALIKISLTDQGLRHLVDDNFGVAPSTTKACQIKVVK